MDKILKENKYKGNPRKITDKQRELLKEHIEELGDLAGVVYCVENKAYVGGNQRSDIFDGSDIQIVERYDTPTQNGTIAHGYIQYNNEKYSYREVSFTESQFKKACVVANNDGGSFDWDILDSWDSDELSEWGLDDIDYSKGLEVNSMSDEDVDIEADFDPIGLSSGLQRVVFIFDGKEEAESYLKNNNIDNYTKKGQAWQVNMSSQSI